MIRVLGFSFALAIVLAVPAAAQHHSDYASYEQRDIKSLSQQQIEDLRTGAGMGLSLAAELNGVPGPTHVLDLKTELSLTAEQIERVTAIRDEMKAEAVRLGTVIVEEERALDRGFWEKSVGEEQIAAVSSRLGALNAELRSVHLQAHLKTRNALSHEQVTAYIGARGYGGQNMKHP